MAGEHSCTQEGRLKIIEKALFGDFANNEVGAIQLIKETHKSVNDMKPAYTLVKNAGIFADFGKKVGNWIIFSIIFVTAVAGAIVGLKEWFKH